MAVDWWSLPGDLLRRIGDHHLAAGDIECYMDMRCVCPGWRAAIPKPRPLGAGAGADLRFRPRHWVMLDGKVSQVAADGRRLFVNVSTGRFLRRRVPMLHDHHLLAASHGLLVLKEKSSPHAARVLDPFTGSVLLRAPDVHEDDGMATVYFVADPASELRVVQFPHYADDREMYYLHFALAHAGHVYVVDSEGCVFRIFDGDERPSFGYGELITKMDFGDGMYPVESAGELLLVRIQKFDGAAEVYRVDVESKVLEPVHSIGRRALFLGWTNCLSVDADKFPSIDPNCVYRKDYGFSGILGLDLWCATHRYGLSNGGKREDITGPLIGPPSLAKVLLDYCDLLADH